MTIDSTPSFDHRHYVIERFGLSPEECEIVLTYMNGIVPYLGGPPSETYLRDELLGAAYWSAQEHAKFGQEEEMAALRNAVPPGWDKV